MVHHALSTAIPSPSVSSVVLQESVSEGNVYDTETNQQSNGFAHMHTG